MKTMLLLLICGTLVSAALTQAASKDEVSGIAVAIKSGDHAKVAEAKKRLKESRAELIPACLNILTNKNAEQLSAQWVSRDALPNTAIELLGRMQAEESIDVLLENLAAQKGMNESHWPFRGYPPAVEALARIGEPAVPKVLERMTGPVDADTLRGLGLVLIHVKGFEGGRKLLEDRIAKEPDDKRRQNLERARDRYLKLPKKLPPPGYDE